MLLGDEFTAVMQTVDDACCAPADQKGDVCARGHLLACGCARGHLLACGSACARVVGPMYARCETFSGSYDGGILTLMARGVRDTCRRALNTRRLEESTRSKIRDYTQDINLGYSIEYRI